MYPELFDGKYRNLFLTERIILLSLIMVMLVGIMATAIATQLMFEQDQVHSSSRVSEIEHPEIFSRPQENQLTLRLFVKFNFILFFLIP